MLFMKYITKLINNKLTTKLTTQMATHMATQININFKITDNYREKIVNQICKLFNRVIKIGSLNLSINRDNIKDLRILRDSLIVYILRDIYTIEMKQIIENTLDTLYELLRDKEELQIKFEAWEQLDVDLDYYLLYFFKEYSFEDKLTNYFISR